MSALFENDNNFALINRQNFRSRLIRPQCISGVCFLTNQFTNVAWYHAVNCFISNEQKVMRRSIRKFNIPPPRASELLKIGLFKFPPLGGKKAVQMPHQLVLNNLSPKTNFVFNKALHMPLRERYAFRKSYSLTKAKFYRVNPSYPAKTEKTHGRIVRTRDKSGSNSPPFQRNVQIPPSPGTMHSQMPRVSPGGMLKFRIDRRITSISVIVLTNSTIFTKLRFGRKLENSKKGL